MNEWNDNQWRGFFGDHSLELRTDKWFTRRVLNRLPRKRWSIEAKISFVVSVLVIAICTVLCLIFALLDLCTHLVGLHGIVCGLRVVCRTVGFLSAQDL